jgi:phosphoribosyl 1,2-cyclic phosphate phosphodiesterase
MPRAVVLGSGTSNGVPVLGVRYPQEYLDNPKNHRTRASILIEGPQGNLLVDCAPELRLQMHREQLFEIDAVLITHTHADHVMGMDDLRSICLLTRKPIPIFTLPAYQQDIRRIYPYAFQEFPPGVLVPRFDLHDVEEEMELCGMRVQILPVPHGNVTTLGLRIGDFAYLTDVSRVPDETVEKLAGLETLLLDAVRFQPHSNHLHYAAAVETAERIGAKTTYFTHLSSDYDHDVFEATMPDSLRLAYDGLRIDIRLETP